MLSNSVDGAPALPLHKRMPGMLEKWSVVVDRLLVDVPVRYVPCGAVSPITSGAPVNANLLLGCFSADDEVRPEQDEFLRDQQSLWQAVGLGLPSYCDRLSKHWGATSDMWAIALVYLTRLSDRWEKRASDSRRSPTTCDAPTPGDEKASSDNDYIPDGSSTPWPASPPHRPSYGTPPFAMTPLMASSPGHFPKHTSARTPHLVLAVALLIATKQFDDKLRSMGFYASVAGVSLQALAEAERAFLSQLHYDVRIPNAEEIEQTVRMFESPNSSFIHQ